MSVINSVLKDLENRGNRFTPIDIQAVPRAASPTRSRRSLWLTAVLLLALAAAGAYLFYQQTRSPAAQAPAIVEPVTAAVADTAPATPAPAVKEPRPVAPRNQILGLQFSEDDNSMRMDFVLRERAVAFLRERGENYFSYHLRDLDSRVEAPLMRGNPWIVALEILPREGGVDVNFETAADVLVETRQHRGDSEMLWSVSLRRAQPVVPAATRAPDPDPASTPVAEAQASATIDTATEPPAPSVEIAPAPAEPVTLEAQSAPEPAEVRLDIRSSDPRAQSAERLAYAVELINSGRYVDAENLLRGLFDGDAEIGAREHLLALYSSRGQRDRFARLAGDSMQRHPAHDLFATEFARSLVASRAYREAVELLNARPRLEPAQHAVLAAAYQRLDQHPAAVRHYRLALDAEPGNARNWVGLGISLEQTTALGEALEAYRKASRLGQLDVRLQAFVARRSETLLQVLN